MRRGSLVLRHGHIKSMWRTGYCRPILPAPFTAFRRACRTGGGVVVSMSSIAGRMGGTIGCNYAASKAGIIGLTQALATELAPDVRFNAVAPGPVDTDLISPEVKERLGALSPLGRIAGPEEIARAVVYLAENDYVNGEVINVNAGRYMN